MPRMIGASACDREARSGDLGRQRQAANPSPTDVALGGPERPSRVRARVERFSPCHPSPSDKARRYSVSALLASAPIGGTQARTNPYREERHERVLPCPHPCCRAHTDNACQGKGTSAVRAWQACPRISTPRGSVDACQVACQGNAADHRKGLGSLDNMGGLPRGRRSEKNVAFMLGSLRSGKGG